MLINAHGVTLPPFTTTKDLEWRWLGASVEFRVLGATRNGRVTAVDNEKEELTAVLFADMFEVTVTGKVDDFTMLR